MTHNFYKYLTAEDKLQIACLNFLRLKHRGAFVVHPYNEGRRTPYERYRVKMLGMVAGMPDIMIYDYNCEYMGLAVELKAGTNRCTPVQIEVHRRLSECGWRVEVCRSLDEFMNLVDGYFK
jgi:hypothetical protein